MKILITSDYYFPEINGVVTSVINLKKGLEKEGHEVRVLTLANGYRECRGNDAYYIGSFGVGAIYPNARVAIPKNCKLIQQIIAWKPDIIHSQCEFSTFVFAKHIAKKTGAPIVHTYHTVYEGYTHYFCPSKVLGKKAVVKFTRRVSRDTQLLIVPTRKMYDMLIGYKIKTDMEIIPSGINTDKYTESRDEPIPSRQRIRKRYGIADGDCLLVFVGRLAKEKNIDEIIDYFAGCEDSNVHLMVVGDGPYRAELEEKCRQYNLNEKVIFVGMVNPEKVPSYYQAGDVFVSASNSETQGLTYMEAMASALPILCKYDSCLDEVIDNGQNGYVYKSEKEFYYYLNRLSKDAQLRKCVGNKARETIRDRYSIDSFVKACERAYRKCVLNNRKTG